jgi:hypothetical protein
MNSTLTDPFLTFNIEDYYVVCSLSAGFTFIAVFICTIILALIWRKQRRLYTAKNLLICNTCMATIFYCVVMINNYIHLLFIQWDTSDISCRWRAYFSAVGITGIIYSYLIQSISRFLFTILSSKYRRLITFKTHHILIFIQWFVAFVVTLPTIITQDIHYYPRTLCWISVNYPMHMVYTIFAYYGIPVLAIGEIYIYIYYQMKKVTVDAITTTNTINAQKRNAVLLRNILVLLGIYLGGALPAFLFYITSIKLIYLVNLVTVSMTIVIEKLCTILLDKEIRQVTKSLICRRTPLYLSIIDI